MNLLNKKVGVVGFGVTGVASVKYLLKRGAVVTVHDKKDTSDIIEKIKQVSSEHKVKYVLGDKYLSGITGYDVIVLSPGISQYQPEIQKVKDANIPIHNDITLFLEEWAGRGKTIGITGSNGKSTVATIIYELSLANNLPAKLAGNIGVSPLDLLDDDIENGTTIVIEVSSYLLEQFTDKHYFDVFILTNISENHLDRYTGMESYIKTKLKGIRKDRTTFITSINGENFVCPPWDYKNIIEWSDCDDILLVDLDDDNNLEKCISLKKDGSVVYKESRQKTKTLLSNMYKRKIDGNHNAYDILYALSALISFPVELATNDTVIENFKGLPHRNQFIAEAGGVKYINDSKSTSPDAIKRALSLATRKNIILIAGGVDKGSNFSSLQDSFKKCVKAVVLLPGTTSAKIEAVAKENVAKIVWSENMRDAVGKATALCEKGDTVLLSPGSASFNLFKSFEDRGEHFIREVGMIEQAGI